MRVESIAFSSVLEFHRSPLGHGFLPMGSYTAVVGQNDAGKSSLLRTLRQGLRSDGRSSRRLLVFCSVDKFEFGMLTDDAIRSGWIREDSAQLPDSIDRWLSRFRCSLPQVSELEVASPEDLLGPFIEELCGSVGDELRPSLSYLAESACKPAGDSNRYLLAFEPDRDGEVPTAHVWLCLPPRSALPDEIVRQVDAIAEAEAADRAEEPDPSYSLDAHLDFIEKQEDLDEETREATKRHLELFRWSGHSDEEIASIYRAMGQAVGQLHPHWDLPEAPHPVLPLGTTTLRVLPEPVELPVTSDDDLYSTLERAISSWLVACRHLGLLEEELQELIHSPDVTKDEIEAELAEDLWFGDASDRWALDPRVPLACHLLSTTAANRLPPEIAIRYAPLVTAAKPSEGSRLAVEISPVSPDEPSAHERFGLDSLAEGYRVWIQLSLLEAASELERHSGLLREHVRSLEMEITDAPRQYSYEQSETLGIDAFDHNAQVGALHARIAEGESLEGFEELYREFPTSGHATSARLLQDRMYFIDEPERHLHPGAQRQVANWVLAMLAETGTPLVVATHSVPFMSVGDSDSASFAHLSREIGEPSTLEPFEPSTLDAIDSVSTELGLNRGELLALLRLFLWVEGPMDRAILDGYFGPRLRERGIGVAVLHGHSNTGRILDAALTQYTRAEVAVWLDKISPEYADSLGDRSHAEEALHRESKERKNLARLKIDAMDRGRTVHSVGVHPPVDDVFELLDETVVQERYPDYPGHEIAQSEFEAAQQAGHAPSKKAFLQGSWKVEVSEPTCAWAAREMRERDIREARLESVLTQCEEFLL